MAYALRNIHNDIWNVINDESRLVGKLFAGIEQKTGKSRYQAALILTLVICMLLTVSPAAGLLCNCICIGYPAMKTLIEMQANKNYNHKQWMFYWVIFGWFEITYRVQDVKRPRRRLVVHSDRLKSYHTDTHQDATTGGNEPPGGSGDVLRTTWTFKGPTVRPDTRRSHAQEDVQDQAAERDRPQRVRRPPRRFDDFVWYN
ncbi:Receptor expression-enhancing protein 5 [Trichinella pseudospiralis]|uniref:Receptor expression-enhancing protein 5 n=1 Tax=Trichinella pseudospiralis TaxID=6337 RepID=A0A0V1J1L9_TRIPS|nr:Receptor expression-enhancing protein 5 [Trichinella pseudospiralis]